MMMLPALTVLLTGSLDLDGRHYAQMYLLHNVNDTSSRPLLHFSNREPQILSENEATEVISRVLGTPSSVAPAPDRRLPSGDLLNRPAGNLLLTVDYFQKGKAASPALSAMAASNAGYQVLLEDGNESPPISFLDGKKSGLGIPATLKQSVGEAAEPLVMCMSADELFTAACDVGSALSWNPTKRQFQTADPEVWMSGAEFQEQLHEQKHGHGVFKLLRSFVANGGVAKFVSGESPVIQLQHDPSADAVEFDMANDADMLLFMELYLMASLPERLSGKAAINDNSPDLFVLTVSGLKYMVQAYGEDSAQYKLALSVVDSAVEQVVENFSQLMPNRLVSEVVLVDSANAAVAASARRLLQAEGSKTAFLPKAPIEIAECVDFDINGELCPPTLGQIERVQLFFWTMVILIIMLIMSTCCLCNMDIGRDSLLYAKFITEHNKAE